MLLNLQNINTERLILIPVTLQITQSLLDGNYSEIEKLGIKLDGSWPTEDTKRILPIIHMSLVKDKYPSGFEFWMIVKKDTMFIIGDIGFHGKPNDKGEVEVGYGLVKHEQGKGYGFEALKAIMNWIDSQDSVRVIKADCQIDNKPSARILEKVGMKEINRDNKLIYWKLDK